MPLSPAESGLPYSQAVVAVRACVTEKGKTHSETHFYASSQAPGERSPAQWEALVRGHWKGVEARNHNRRDVGFGEDRFRSRNVNIRTNFALMVNLALDICSSAAPFDAVSAVRQHLASNPRKAVSLVLGRSKRLTLKTGKEPI